MADFRLDVDIRGLKELDTRTHRLLGQVVRKAALDIEAHAKGAAPVDTGHLKSSIQAQMTGELTAEVAVGAEYGAYVELGTVRAAPRPYLGPAVEAVSDGFAAAVAAAVRQAAEKRG